MSFRNLAIARKLTLLMTVTSLGVAVAAIGTVVLSETLREGGRRLDTARVLLEVTARNAAEAMWWSDRLSAERVLASFQEVPGVLAARLYTPEGRPFAAYLREGVEGSRTAPLGSVPRNETRLDRADSIDLLAPVLRDDDRLGTMQLRVARPRFRDGLPWAVRFGGSLFGLAALLAYLVSRRVQGLVTEPVRRLAEAMGRVARGEGEGVRVPVDGGDEVGTLAAGFNAMLEQIERRGSRVARLATAVERATEGIVVVEAGGQVVYSNPALTELTGVPADEVRETGVVAIVPDGNPARSRLAAALRGGRGWSERVRGEHRAGHAYDAEWTLAPVVSEGGRHLSTVVILRDVTHEVRLEEHLAHGQKLEALGRLAGGVAHDFNNILTPILGHAELAEDLVGEDDPARAHLGHIVRGAERARKLIAQILGFAGADADERRVLGLGQVVEESSGLIQASLPETIRLDVCLSGEDDRVEADPTRLQQVVLNLCTNAWHAMEETGGTLGVRLDRTRVESTVAGVPTHLPRGDYVVLKVADTGCGIPEGVRDRIFDPFFTTKGEGRGTGLGLAAVQSIVADLGGGLWVESEPGKGSEFSVYLPASGGPKGVVDNRLARPPALGRGQSILVVDDEHPVVELLAQVLEAHGYRPEVFTSGPKALERFQGDPSRFDLLVTDYTMPDLNGLSLSHRCRELRPDLPVLLCTGFAPRITPEAAAEAGIHQVISKPPQIRELLHAVAEALDGGKGG